MLDTTNGTAKLTLTRSHTAGVPPPPAIIAPWLTADNKAPTTRATGSAVRIVTPQSTMMHAAESPRQGGQPVRSRRASRARAQVPLSLTGPP